MLTTPPVLTYYDPSKPTVVQADASSTSLGCVILQSGQPIKYASRAMTQSEQSFAQIEKEQLAILFALERFHSYCYCNPDLTIETDHRPLLGVSKKALSAAPKRLQQMLLRLQRYNYKLVYKPGSQLILTDALSRATPENVGTTAIEFPEQLASLMDLQELTMVASKQCIDMIHTAAADDEEYDQLKARSPRDGRYLTPLYRPRCDLTQLFLMN